MDKIIKKLFLLGLIALLLTACREHPWNDPYPADQALANIHYSSFAEQPKTLDPAKSYSVDETTFIAQIYEPPLQYHYLKRPYQLVPLTATALPAVTFLDSQGRVLAKNAPAQRIAYTVYTIQIKPGIYYQPHPAFAKNAAGTYEYLNSPEEQLSNKDTLQNFPHTGTRELTADDYVYEIKRLADPRVQSPLYGLLSNYIVGLADLNADLQKKYAELRQQSKPNYIDLRQTRLAGVQTLNNYTYSIRIKGYYPQFIYWLALPFFAPMPWEADAFYSQPGMQKNNLTLAWYPVGTGPYLLAENNPNRRMVLVRNPNFHAEFYPSEGMPQDKSEGLLAAAGKRLPFIDKFIFTLEKESVPRWNKFLQGYYDQSAISNDSFDQAISIDAQGNPIVTPLLKQKGVRLRTVIAPNIFYTAFNMLDPVVGGYSEQAKALRQAIAIMLNTEEYIAIFLNGRGIPAQGPLPPGIFGYREGLAGINPVVYKVINGQRVRRSLAEAKQLLVKAGYSDGRDPKTNQPLLLNIDLISGASGDDQSYFSWLREEFAKIGIELQVRDTQYNRFQEKIRNGQAQLFTWAWTADYPDPENFLFLLYGPNGKVKFGGENAANYANPAFDALFVKMRNLSDGPERQAVIDQMISIVRQDSPWIWGYYPQTFILTQSWLAPLKPSEIAYNTLKYLQIDPRQRNILRQQWNQPVFWPLFLALLIYLLCLAPVFILYWRKQRQSPKNQDK